MNLRALEKVARIGCKYQPSFTIYIYWASPAWGLALGQLHCSSVCVCWPWFSQPSGNTMTLFIILDVWDYLWVFLKSWRVGEPVRVLCTLWSVLMVFMLKHKDSITTPVTLALAFMMLVWGGGRPLHSSMMIWRLHKVRALCMCCCVAFFFFSSISSTSFLSACLL